jgi:tripeptidyl-peptidase-1
MHAALVPALHSLVVNIIFIRDIRLMSLTGARGVSILFSSGDGGVGDGNADPATQECQTNDGRNITRFIPAFPAAYAS